MKKLIILILMVVGSLFAQEQLVITAIPALASIADSIVKGTDITVKNVIGNDTPLNELKGAIKDSTSSLEALAPHVSAVLTLQSVIPDDVLYFYTRLYNIRAIEIDAATPLNPTINAIGTIRTNDGVNPYVWTSPSAVIRMTEVIGKDLMALFPKDSVQLNTNMKALRKSIIALKSEYEKKFIKLDNFEAATMDNSFDYLIKDINLFVTNKFPHAMDWTEKDYKAYDEGLKNLTFATIIHRWEPMGDIADKAKAAGVSFTILTPGMPGLQEFNNGIIAYLQKNLEAVYQGLKK